MTDPARVVGDGTPRVGQLAATLLLAGVLAVAAGGPLLAARGEEAPASKPPVQLSLEEARRAVRMMDDIYHAGVLTTHMMYVQEPGLPAAVTWAKQVMARVEAQGWPDARIFASDRPLNPENQPADNFERAAIAAFRQGTPRYEQVEPAALRYASEIRIADRSCLSCHVRSKVGDLVGGVSYRVLLKQL